MRVFRKVILAFMILLCFLVAGQTLAAESKGKVLLILSAHTTDDYMILREFDIMKTTLSDAGFTVIVANVDGKPVQGQTKSVTPDVKLSDVKVADYKGLILPCMHTMNIPDDSVKVVKKALAQGKPIAAQNAAVRVLSLTHGLEGKNFAISAYFAAGANEGQKLYGGTYRGIGVVQDRTS